jgi:hypothetical protein
LHIPSRPVLTSHLIRPLTLRTRRVFDPLDGCLLSRRVHISSRRVLTPSNAAREKAGEGKDMVSETPPHVKSCWTGTHPNSASYQLIATQLIHVWNWGPFVVRRARGRGVEMWGIWSWGHVRVIDPVYPCLITTFS